MKHFITGGLGLTVLLLAGLTVCRNSLPQTVQSQIDSFKEEATDKAAESIKESILSQLDDFIHSSDSNNEIVISEEDKVALEASIDDYLDSYDWNTEELEKVKSELSSFWKELSEKNSASSFSKEELNKKLNEILRQ